MALPVLRSCYRAQSTLTLARLVVKERIVVNRCCKTRIPPLLPVGAAAASRSYSSKSGGDNTVPSRIVKFSIPNPVTWFRTRIYAVLIRAYFDKEFSFEEFTAGAKQAFSHVSKLLSLCQFEALEGLVAKDMIATLKEKCSLLPLSYKKALSAESDEILHTTPADVKIYYDDNGRKFVSIQMGFWYLTSEQLPDDMMMGGRTFQIVIGDTVETKAKRLLTANYEFQREFTKGASPDWTITRIEHFKLLE